MARKITEDEFIQRAVDKYGDFFDFDKVVFTGMSNEVEIICPKHGTFRITPRNFLHKMYGCNTCSKEKSSIKKSKSTEEFITEAKNIFPQFDYSKVEYINNKTKVNIMCPIHGEFKVDPLQFLKSPNGCPKCYQDSRKITNTLEKLKVPYIENPKISKNGYIGSIYMFQNKINNKIYIGKTIDPYLNRISAHKSNFSKNLSNSAFYKAINKYGWDSFAYGVLFQTDEYSSSEEDKLIVDKIIIEKEIEYIKLYNSTNRNIGYNLTTGGEGIVGYKFSDEQKEKMSKSRSGENHHNYGKKYVNGNAIYQLDLEGKIINLFNNTVEAADKLNLNKPNITKCLNHGGTAGGFIWIKVSDFENFLLNKEENIKNIIQPKNHKIVFCFNNNGDKIAEYKNCAEACKIVGGTSSNITKVAALKDFSKQAKKYYWIYEQDFTHEIYKEKFGKDYE